MKSDKTLIADLLARLKRHNCVVCGGRNDGNHHCPPATIAAVERGRAAHSDRHDYAKWYGTRLRDGFRFYNEDYNYDN